MRGRRLLLPVGLAALLALPGSALAQDPAASQAPIASPAASIVPGVSPQPGDPTAPIDPALAEPDPAETSAAGLPYGTVRLMAVGDVMLGRTIGKRVRQSGPGIVFKGVQSVLDRADLFVINLECDITTSTDREDKHYTFKAPPITADALSMAGVDVASMANNHAMDWGEQGLTDTLGYLAERGIASPGGGHDRAEAYAPVVVRRNGLSIAFLSYVDAFTESTGFNTKEWKAGPSSPGLAIANVDRIRADVAKAKPLADLVVVLVHAGWEYYPNPNNEQKAYARAALDAGATLYLGHHPHVLQGFKREGKKLIAWSLGNFVFDGMDGASITEILIVDLTKDGVVRVKHRPVKLVDGFPTLQ
jgi:poly-gamma-glutamate synthesis protein (capsule biosynthesis protein)